MWSVLILVLIAYLARWVLTGVGSRGDRQLEAQHTAELARLRDEVDGLTAQLLRLQDEQSFMMRLLSDGGARPEAALPPPEVPHTTTTEKP